MLKIEIETVRFVAIYRIVCCVPDLLNYLVDFNRVCFPLLWCVTWVAVSGLFRLNLKLFTKLTFAFAKVCDFGAFVIIYICTLYLNLIVGYYLIYRRFY